MGVETIVGNPFPENLLSLWETLLSRSSLQNPFLTPLWSRLWLLHFRRNLEVKTLLCRSSAGDPIGLGVFSDSGKGKGKRGLTLYFSFRYQGVEYVYNSGYDPEYGRLSPGIVLAADCIRRAMERGMTVFHFLRGQEDYKYRLGGKEEKIYQIQAVKG
jgi:hypothetical protein